MTVFVAGATGATGRLLVRELLDRGQEVRAVVRSPDRLPAELRAREGLSMIHANLLELDHDELTRHVIGCEGVASCLGHNLTWRGMFGPPRRLVTDATRRLCAAIRAAEGPRPTRFVLMNTNGHRNVDLNERRSFGDGLVIALLRHVLPPQRDNEEAAEFLRVGIGRDDPAIEWAAVRPDNLVDEAEVTAYETHPSPTRGVIFGAGRTSRVNVAHFMATLLTGGDAWREWRGGMPVIYNAPGRERRP